MPPFFHPLAVLALAAALALTSPLVRAEEGFLQDLSGGQAQDLPAWMQGAPVAVPAKHATLGFGIKPPAAEEDLLVTVFFHEKPGGFLRVYWDDGFNKEMLCENLSEGTGMLNRRTLLIKRPVMVASGVLTFQSSEATLGVERIFWQWSQVQPVYLDEPWLGGGVLGRSGDWLADDEIDGWVPTPRADSWLSGVVTAPISQKPDRIEQGMDFIATLAELPKLARVEVQVGGLPLTSSLKLLVNGHAAGALQMPVPDLSDPGLEPGKDGVVGFTGWRKATLLVDAALLVFGENHFQFVAEPAATALAVKNFNIQLQYP